MSFTDAWAENATTAPAGEVELITLEIRHSAIVDGSGNPDAIRLVLDEEDHDLRLENGAPLHGGQTKTFKAAAFIVQEARIGADALPECDITLDVGPELVDLLSDAVKEREQIIIRVRSYLLSDPDHVGREPFDLVLREVVATAGTITGAARFAALQNTQFPTKTYDREQFPTLIAGL